jgi:hypothetical protein
MRAKHTSHAKQSMRQCHSPRSAADIMMAYRLAACAEAWLQLERQACVRVRTAWAQSCTNVESVAS